MALASVGTFLAGKYGPLAVQGGLTAASALYGAITPNRAQELQEEVLEGYRELRSTAQRQARGQFTTQEREQMRADAQPQLQKVAGSVASRGLGSSPAGAAITAGAEQAVFTNAQRQAMIQEQVVNREAFAAASQMANEDASFFEDLRAISAAYQQIRSLGGTPDPAWSESVERAVGLREGYRGVDSRGDDI